MEREVVEVMERVYMFHGEPISWWKSYDHGRTWTKVNCSLWDGKPPFIMFNYSTLTDVALVQRTEQK